MRKAFQVLLIVVLAASVFVMCSKSTDTDLFEKGKKLELSGEYEKALNKYSALAKTHETSSLRAEALCRAGLIHVVRHDNTEKGIEIFKQVKEEYPEEIIGQGCGALVDFLSSEKAKDDVERLYNIGLAYTNLINDFPTGIGVLNDLVEKHPENNRAPEALFMCGFILANSSADTAEARVTYNRFLEKYPEHDLTVSVEWELEHLGQDINTIPEMQQINSDDLK